jgi:UDP:flavonoid glycosyltransferase YjiC (YdhE family)
MASGMAKILVAPAMYSGHLLPHLAVAQALRSMDQEVVVYAEPEAEALVRQSDCAFEPMSIGGAREAFGAAASSEAVTAAFAEVAERSAPELVAVLARHEVQAALVDSLHVGAALAVERHAIPWATLATTPVESHPSFADAPVHRVPTEALRRRLGLTPSSRTSYEQACSEALLLQPWTPEFDGGVRSAAGLHIGPLGWRSPEESVPSWAHERDPARPLVVITASSWSIDALAPYVRQYIDAAVAALGRLPVRGVLGLGPYEPPVVVPDNVRVAPFVPHSAIMPDARALITHGGWGSVSRGLLAGAPMIVVPFAADQPLIAEMCEQAGVGIYLPSELVEEDALVSILQELLSETDPRRQAVTALASRTRAEPPAELAARRLLALI